MFSIDLERGKKMFFIEGLMRLGQNRNDRREVSHAFWSLFAEETHDRRSRENGQEMYNS